MFERTKQLLEVIESRQEVTIQDVLTIFDDLCEDVITEQGRSFEELPAGNSEKVAGSMIRIMNGMKRLHKKNPDVFAKERYQTRWETAVENLEDARKCLEELEKANVEWRKKQDETESLIEQCAKIENRIAERKAEHKKQQEKYLGLHEEEKNLKRLTDKIQEDIGVYEEKVLPEVREQQKQTKVRLEQLQSYLESVREKKKEIEQQTVRMEETRRLSEEALGQAQEEYQKQQEEYQRQQEMYKKLHAEEKSLRELSNKLQEEIKIYQEDVLPEIREQINQKQDFLEHAAEQKTGLEQELANILADYQKEKNELDEQTEAVTTTRTELQKVKDNLQSMICNKARMLEESGWEIAALKKELGEKQQQQLELEEELKNQKSQCIGMQREIEQIKQQKNLLEKQYAAVVKQREDEAAELSKLNQKYQQSVEQLKVRTSQYNRVWVTYISERNIELSYENMEAELDNKIRNINGDLGKLEKGYIEFLKLIEKERF